MKTLILTAVLFVFGAGLAQANSGSECHQDETSSIRIVREFK